jgi:very-short-patch-repair endonuclease
MPSARHPQAPRLGVPSSLTLGHRGLMTTTVDPALRALAAGQHGMFTAAQARSLAVSPLVLERLVRQAHLLHPGRGLYAVTEDVDQEAEAWHRHLCAGAHLLYDDASLTSASAALAHGLPVWGVDLRRPDLHRPVDRAVGVKAFRVRPRPKNPTRPLPVTTDLGATDEVGTALVQLALDHGPVAGSVSADHALHVGKVTLDQLDDAASLVSSWPRSSRVRAMLGFVDGRSESVGETRCRIELMAHGIQLTPQVPIREPNGGLIGRVDFLVEGTMVIVEFDGKVKYADGDANVLWDEKRREDRLRALGYTVVRITWADLERPGAAVGKVRRALAKAA